MTKNDVKEFTLLFKQSYELYNRVPSDGAIVLAFKALMNYDIGEIRRALDNVLTKSNFAPTIADIVNEIKLLRHEDKESLKVKANIFYDTLSNNLNRACDYVTDDLRGAIAFKRSFGSLVNFCNQKIDSEPFNRKNFVESYVKLELNDFKNDIQQLMIKGINHDKKPSVRYLGKFDTCEKIAKSLYIDGACYLPQKIDKQLVVTTPQKQKPIDKVEINGAEYSVKNIADVLKVVSLFL